MAHKLHAYPSLFTYMPKFPHFRQDISSPYKGCDFKMRKEKPLNQAEICTEEPVGSLNS